MPDLRLVGALAPLTALLVATPAWADGLRLSYPYDGYSTPADRIYFVGTAAPGGEVTLNGQPVHRSPAGHFAPSTALRPGPNVFTLRHAGQALTLTITRKAGDTAVPPPGQFQPGSLQPGADRAVQPGEGVCFSATAAAGAHVAVRVGGRTIPLVAQPAAASLPDNKAGLTGRNQPIESAAVRYAACTAFQAAGLLGKPVFVITAGGRSHEEPAPGALEVMRPERPRVVEVLAEHGIARSGPATDYSRLTPLPRGTRAAVTGRDGDFLRLASGVWIHRNETVERPGATPPRTIVRSLRARSAPGLTEITIPLEQPVPVAVEEADGVFTLRLHGAVAQTDIIRMDDDALVSRLDWTQEAPDRVAYRFNLKQRHPWGYVLRYDGPTLVLGLRHAPPADGRGGRLDGLRVVLDAGHGGAGDQGTHGPTGLAEKDLTLPLARLVRSELEARGATVRLSREADVEVGLADRQAFIAKEAPHASISLHYNALPDTGDAERLQGTGAFYYHAHSHALARALHAALTTGLGRASYGLWWDNLALARPSVAPAVLMEIGFFTNPEDFEFCVDPAQQRRVAAAIADGLAAWLAEPR